MSFRVLGLSEALLKNLKIQGYDIPYPIQEAVIPAVLSRKDVLGIAKTGSGKSASYVLPILEALFNKEGAQNRYVSTLILVPTRELAVQVHEVFKIFQVGAKRPIKSIAVFGGVSINPQMKALNGVDILVATPGRLLDLVNSNAIHLSKVRTLVLDECDKMLGLGFEEEMNKIFKLLPDNRQNLLFSATTDKRLEKVHKSLLSDPTVIMLVEEEKASSLDQINQIAYFVSPEKKGPLLRHLIKVKKMTQVLVFTASGRKADNVAEKLRKNGIEARAIHSKKTQGVRTDLLTKFKYGKLPVLVSTDLLARGIDIELLPFVLNYELPRSPKDFVHRIGRTGRADAKGEAITFVTPEDEHHFKVIQKKMGKWLTLEHTDEIKF